MREAKMKKVILLIIFLILITGQPLLAAEQPFTIEVTEETVITKDKIEAKGGVVISLQQGSIKADKVVAVLEENLIKATGNVILIQGDQEVSGTSLEYNYETQQGVIKNSQAEENELTVKGRTIEVNQETMVAKDASLTPCIREVPHYKLTAETVTVYPGDKLIATGVWFWVKDIKLYPLFTYKLDLSEEGAEAAGDRATFLEPSAGYNQDDGWFGAATYHHYINEQVSGEVYGKYAQKETHQFQVDYTWSPGDYFTFDPRLDYHHQHGWDYYGQVQNDWGPIKSNLQYGSLIEKDEEDDSYGERKWKGSYQLDMTWEQFAADLDLKREEGVPGEKKVEQELNLEQGWKNLQAAANFQRKSHLPAEEPVEQIYTLTQDWPEYYWELKQSYNRDVNYRPQLTLGMKEKQWGLTGVAADIKTGRISETDTEVTTRRDSLALQLNQDFTLTESTELRAKEKVVAAHYGTGDNYQSYDLNLNLKQQTSAGELGVDYQHYDQAGTTPFAFDQMLDDGFGRRYRVGADLNKKGLQLTDGLETNWQLHGSQTVYESGHEFGRYGGNLGVTYQLNDYNKLELGYNQQRLTGRPPGPEINREADNLDDVAEEIKFVEEEDLEVANEISGSYSFQTNQQEWPYWKVKVDAGYDLLKEELSTLEYSATREYDCFKVNFNFDQLEEKFDWQIDFKY